MKSYILFLFVAMAIFFNACATTMTPEEIDLFAIKPNKLSKIFSPPKDGYARLIMYRKADFFGAVLSYAVVIKYTRLGHNVADRALCKMNNGSSCIVNIKAGNFVALTHWGMENKTESQVLFLPKNRHIYCASISIEFGWLIGQMQFNFVDAETCLAEYKAVYKPKHRDYQKQWFDKLVEKGDKRAYKE